MKKLLSATPFLVILLGGMSVFGQKPIINPFYIYLKDLVDVSSTAPTDNCVLTYDAATKLWGPEAAAGGGAVDISGTPEANDFSRWTDADTLEGRSVAEVLADLSLEEADIEGMIDTLANLTSIQGQAVTFNVGLTVSTNLGILDFTGSGKTLTVEDSATVNQDLSSDAAVTFGSITSNSGTPYIKIKEMADAAADTEPMVKFG